MKLSPFVRRHERALVGSALGLAALAWLRSWTGPKAAVPAQPVKPSSPMQVQGDPLVAQPGKTYAAVIVTHGAVNAASQPAVVGKAVSLGFKGVQATDKRPAGFPGTATGDWYVTATWPGPGPSPPLQRSNGSSLAGADVVDVWQLP